MFDRTFGKNLCLNDPFSIIVMHIFYVGQIILDGKFWAIGRFNSLVKQSILLVGQMLTQYTCTVCRGAIISPSVFH